MLLRDYYPHLIPHPIVFYLDFLLVSAKNLIYLFPQIG